ncbi:hypothetical protein SLEP1_g48787 [Rubroshorea leprosula]|uniref:Exostosin GT47 domain-containing protein n=1 Tax=Rubroshorea leprosula TaxID=152421 RepID=A0AAV5LUY2_9ROSI|nr:hypothetical protein SLEP1_g48787 [Rubroshorea leprosula]
MRPPNKYHESLLVLYITVPLAILETHSNISIAINRPSFDSSSLAETESSSSASNGSSSNALEINGTVQLKQDISKNNESDGKIEVLSRVVKRYSKLQKVEARLAKARSSIREAALVRNLTSTHQDPDYVLQGPMYRNPIAFHRSYLEMEKLFKVYVYEEGEPPIFHQGPCRSIYSTEGRFIHELEKGTSCRTKDPDQALVYFLPFSVVMMVEGLIGGPSPSGRSILAFFAGRLHGHIRYLLLKEWKGKDGDVQVYDQLPNGVSYLSKLKNSKFCLCPSGYEVASPRIVEAIYAECVPVLISDSYVPPFSDVLNWKAFAVEVPVKDIPNIKKILTSIPQRQYLKMQRRVKQVQRHFVVNGTPKRFDVFYMTLHSIWLRRLNIKIHDFDSP